MTAKAATKEVAVFGLIIGDLNMRMKNPEGPILKICPECRNQEVPTPLSAINPMIDDCRIAV